MSRPTIFVILTTQRSGSGWLVDLLDDHPAIAAYEELFRVATTNVAAHGATVVPRFEVMVGPGTFSTSSGLVPKRYGYVRGLARAHPEAGAVGFKLMYDQTRDHPGLMHALTLVRARFIHLVRRDSLSALISFDVASERRQWHYYTGDTAPALRARTDVASLLGRLEERDREIDRFRRRLARLPAQVHEVAYEDLVERHDVTLRRILEFLHVPPTNRPLRSSLVRPTAARAVDLLENRADVVAALAGTPYEVTVA